MITVLKAYTLSECMETLADCIACLEKKGEENLIFCEDRLTLVAEKSLVNRLGGSFLTQVTTFTRFLGAKNKALTKQGSVMAIGKVMAELQRQNRLQCFDTIARIGNNAGSIYETIAQFSASEITPEIIQNAIPELTSDTLKRKLSDLALIYQGYLNFLDDNEYMDESRYLSVLPTILANHKKLKETNVFFLCYDSFTAQAVKTLCSAFKHAKNVYGVFCAGEEDLYTNKPLNTFIATAKRFEEPIIKECGKPLDGDAELLRKALFTPEALMKGKKQTDKIQIFEAEDKSAEAEFVAIQIKKALAENPDLRYRDFAVLLPELSAYSLPIKRAFYEYGIPFYIDEKHSLLKHPLSRFLLDCLRVVKERFSPSSVQSLTGNYFFGESDEYRNYLLKFANYRMGATREIKQNEAVDNAFDRTMLEEGRKRLLLATHGISQNATGRGYCARIRKIISDFDVAKKLELLNTPDVDEAHKGYLAQVMDTLEKVLIEAELLTGDVVLSVAEFSTILQNGLEATEISLIPAKADAVFIGDITESRIEKVHTLFAMGMTDEVPKTQSDASIISDREITQLKNVQAMLEPTVLEVNLRHRESVCLNLCTFMQNLFLTYATPSDGSEPSLSEVFRYVNGVFGDKVKRPKTLSETELAYRCSAPVPAVRRLIIEKQEFENRKENSQRIYSSIYTALDKLSVSEKDEYLEEQDRQVCVDRGEELFFKGGKISPTSLENYFTCPFKHFIERGLKLKEREETAVLAVDSGNFIHELLEIVTKKTDELSSEEELKAFAKQTGEEIMKKPVYSSQSDTASGLFFSEKLLQEGVEVSLAVYRQLKNSLFSVEATEKTVSTPDIYGKVDRVDSTDNFVRVIDYKTGSIDDDATSYYVGKKLQLQLYMSSLKGEKVPAGVFYFPASVSYGDEENRFRMKGFMNGNPDALMAGDINITADKQSEYFPASLKNTSSKKVMDEEVFRDFLDYSVLLARQGANELKEGYIAPTPYGETCTYCKYGGMCGFNPTTCTPRKESGIEPKKIAEIAREVRDGKEEHDE